MPSLHLHVVGINGSVRYANIQNRLYFCETDILRHCDIKDQLTDKYAKMYSFAKHQRTRAVSYETVLNYLTTQGFGAQFAQLCADLRAKEIEKRPYTRIPEQHNRNDKFRVLKESRDNELKYLERKVDLLRQMKELELSGPV